MQEQNYDQKIEALEADLLRKHGRTKDLQDALRNAKRGPLQVKPLLSFYAVCSAVSAVNVG